MQRVLWRTMNWGPSPTDSDSIPSIQPPAPAVLSCKGPADGTHVQCGRMPYFSQAICPLVLFSPAFSSYPMHCFSNLTRVSVSFSPQLHLGYFSSLFNNATCSDLCINPLVTDCTTTLNPGCTPLVMRCRC